MTAAYSFKQVVAFVRVLAPDWTESMADARLGMWRKQFDLPHGARGGGKGRPTAYTKDMLVEIGLMVEMSLLGLAGQEAAKRVKQGPDRDIPAAGFAYWMVDGADSSAILINRSKIERAIEAQPRPRDYIRIAA